MNKITSKLKQSFAIFLIFTLIFAMFPGAVGAEEALEDAEIEDAELTEDESVDDGNEDTSEQPDKEQENSDETTEETDENKSSELEDSNRDEEKEDRADEKEDTSNKNTSNNESDEQGETDNNNDKSVDEEKSQNNKSSELKYNPDKVKEKVRKSLERSKTYYENNPPVYNDQNKGFHSEYWMFSALWGAGYKNLNEDFPWGDSNPWSDGTYWSEGITGFDEEGEANRASSANEEAGIIVSTIMLGMDPHNFGDRDIVADLLEREGEDGLFSTIWGEPWVLIALDLADADYDRNKHIESIVAQQGEDGMFGYDVDTTAWMMMALAPYKNTNEDAANTINKLEKWAHELFLENDEIQGAWGPNANTTAAIIMGLSSIGEDLYSEKWTNQNGSIIEQLLVLQQDDGSFWWTKEEEGAPGMANDQSFFAIATVVNEGSIFMDFKNYEPELEPEPEPEPKPEESNDKKEISINEQLNITAGETIIIKDSKSQMIIPDNLPEGVKLTVTTPINEIKHEGLKLAGDWFDLTLEGMKGFTGTFTLSLGVDDGVNWDKVDVYHYNEQLKQWELVKGIKNKEDRTITVEVSDFSIYGVFEKEEEKAEVEIAAESNTNKQNETGERLPDTATNTFNIMLVGIVLLVLGSTLIILRKKNLKKVI